MFRKLLPWTMAALLVVLVIAGCSKKPAGPEDDLATNYAPASLVTYPDTVKVTVQWVRNSEAEAQGGFGGYYVYCTSRSMTYAGTTTDSIVGLAQLPPESLQYFQVAGSPFVGTDAAVVTQCYDQLTGNMVNLARGTKYYFYVRTMVDGELSWASNWGWSSPRPEGDARIYAFVSMDTLAGDSGRYGALEFKRGSGIITPTLYRTPITTWRDTLIDSTVYVIDTTVTPHDTTITPVMTITPSGYDSVLCGYMDCPLDNDTLYTKRIKIDSAGNTMFRIPQTSKRYVGPMTAPVTAIDLVARKISATQVELQSPQTNTAIPVAGFWGTTGKETLIQPLSGGWAASAPETFMPTSHNIIVTVGETGTVYQIYASGYYAKIRIDAVTAAGNNSIRVDFHYAYQMAAGVKSF